MVRTRLQTAPAFVRFLVSALVGGLVAAAIHKLWDHDSWGHALVSGLFLGVLLEVVETFTTGRRRDDIDAITAGLTAAQQQQVLRTSPRNPVPSNAAVRQAAIRFAEYRLAEYDRHHVAGRWVVGVFAAVFLVLALTTSPFYWVGVVVIVYVLAQELSEPRRLRRRLEMLRAAPAGQSATV